MVDLGVTKDTVMTNVISGKSYICDAPDESHEVEYPHTYFDKKLKPVIKIRGKSSTTVDAYRRAARSIVNGQQGSIEYILGYLYKVGQTIKGELQRDWESFGIKIGKVGDVVTPMHLVTVEFDETDSYPEIAKTEISSDKEDHWLLLSILGAPRYKRAGENQTVATALVETFNSLYKQGTFDYPKEFGFDSIILHNNIPIYKTKSYSIQ